MSYQIKGIFYYKVKTMPKNFKPKKIMNDQKFLNKNINHFYNLKTNYKILMMNYITNINKADKN